MNQSLTDDEWIKIEKQFFKDYLKWSKSNRKSLAPIYPPELNDSNIGDDEWDYKGNEKLLVDEKKDKRVDLIKRMVNAYKQKKLDKIKQNKLWKGFT